MAVWTEIGAVDPDERVGGGGADDTCHDRAVTALSDMRRIAVC